MNARLLLCLTLAVCAACARPYRAIAAGPTPQGQPELTLPQDWETCSALKFERFVDQLARGGVRWSAAELGAFERSLEGAGAGAVRAAVLCAYGADEASQAVLVRRLSARAVAPGRSLDAGDVVAAAALADFNVAPTVLSELTPLVTGPDAHPDLEVRVELAGALLTHKVDAVQDFLFTVLRAGTPDAEPIDWEPTRSLAWAKSRAADALARRAGTDQRFNPDGSFAAQEAETRRLETLLTGTRDALEQAE